MKQFPDAIQKRDLLHGRKKLSAEARALLAKEFEAAGWLSDAADFSFDNPTLLQELCQKAAAEGNTFLVMKIFRILGKEDHELLQRAAEKAESLGKTRYALKVYEKLGNTAKVDAIKSSIADDGDMKTALNSVFIPKSEDEREDEELDEN